MSIEARANSLFAWVAVVLLTAVGCASPHQKDVEQARADYDRCVEEHSESHPECVSLRETYRVAQERYEAAARRAWSCDPTQDECPRKR